MACGKKKAPPAFEAASYRERAGVPAIAFAAVTRDATVLLGAEGKKDASRPDLATSDTAFEAASIAKTIIATCVMQLVEDKRLRLDEDVSSYVGFTVRHPRSTAAISLRMLLSHTSSIRDRNDELARATRAEPLGRYLEGYLVKSGKPDPDAFDPKGPGETAAYSNVGASLAALAVERMTKTSFDVYATTHIFVPLDMRRTAWAASALDDTASGHTFVGGRFVRAPAPSHAVYPVVDLFSSSHDLSRFARAILRGGELDGVRILSAESIRVMQGKIGAYDDALGWQLRTIGSGRAAGHEGEDVGASTALFLDMNAGAGAVVLANGDAFSSENAARAKALQGLLADLLDRARTSATQGRPVSSRDAD